MNYRPSRHLFFRTTWPLGGGRIACGEYFHAAQNNRLSLHLSSISPSFPVCLTWQNIRILMIEETKIDRAKETVRRTSSFPAGEKHLWCVKRFEGLSGVARIDPKLHYAIGFVQLSLAHCQSTKPPHYYPKIILWVYWRDELKNKTLITVYEKKILIKKK